MDRKNRVSIGESKRHAEVKREERQREGSSWHRGPILALRTRILCACSSTLPTKAFLIKLVCTGLLPLTVGNTLTQPSVCLSSTAFHKHSCGASAGCLLACSLTLSLCWSGVGGSRGRRVKCQHVGLVEVRAEAGRVGSSSGVLGRVFGRKGSVAKVGVCGVRGLGAQAECEGEREAGFFPAPLPRPPQARLPPGALPEAASPSWTLQPLPLPD